MSKHKYPAPAPVTAQITALVTELVTETGDSSTCIVLLCASTVGLYAGSQIVVIPVQFQVLLVQIKGRVHCDINSFAAASACAV